MQDLNSDDPIVSQARLELELLPKSSLMYHVNKGILGHNLGLSNGLGPMANKYMKGSHRARYYLIGADSGVGKTTFADYIHAYNLMKACEAKGIELELDYYSWEISEGPKKAKWASMIYFYLYGEFIPSDSVLSMEEGFRLTPDRIAKLKVVGDEVDRLFNRMNFIEQGKTPTEIWKRICERAARTGDLIMNSKSTDSMSSVVGYVPTKEQPVRWSIFDHVALADQATGVSLKANIDLLSTYMVKARNIFGDSATVIQQFNTEMQHAARERKSPMAYMPSRQDFGDSKYTFRDADVVLGLVRPVDFGLVDLNPFSKLDEWGNYFLLMTIMKNRYGGSNRTIPLFMNYVSGIPEELPSNKWNELVQDLYIERAKTLDECQ